ncbi:MAG: DUF169 domain-containing protein [Syntrophales bacterium]|jgi:uncharacterized protein (DUF169 family)|nr:DUF169 domain-containing protein [Syntrophales bacterium]MDY0043045.1 DUF169 domain-containing protein [Syntrophales bacterium]
MIELEEYRNAGRRLTDALRLYTDPVAVKYIRNVDEIPSEAIRPCARGQKWSLCQAISYSRRWHMHTAMTSEDNFCVPATVGHRWEIVPEEDLIESQVRQKWHKNRTAEENKLQFFYNFLGKENYDRMEQFKGFVTSPLTETVIIPDSILIYGDGVQITHIIQSLTYEFTSPLISSFDGFGESCMKGTLIPFLTGKPQIVIPGMGDRAFSGTTENEIAIGIPGLHLFSVLENLFKAGGKLNMGQPARTVLPNNITERITPGFSFMYDKIQEYKSRNR